MFGSLTSPKRERVSTLRLIHSLALRACILNGFREHGAVPLVARQVLIWGLPVDPIFADGAANLRSRAAPSARIEPRVLFLTEN
jgi:hypothetical protein